MLNITIPIFEATFLNVQALFLFDHTTSHTADASDALHVSHMNIDSGRKQPYLDHGVASGLYMQKKSFDLDNLSIPSKWQEMPKEYRRVLQECSL